MMAKQNKFTPFENVPCKNEIEARGKFAKFDRKTSHMLNVPYNFLNGFELISKMTRGASQSAEIRRSAEKSHVCKLQGPLPELLAFVIPILLITNKGKA